MSELLDKITTRVHARREKWVTFEVKDLPMPQDFGGEPVIVGGYTRCGTHSHTRFIRRDILMSVDGCKEPPSALAKDYLNVEYGRGPILRTNQMESIENTISAHPLYCNPCVFDHGFYIDIRSCYWSVIQTVGWKVDYWPGEWIGGKHKPQNFPWPRHKIARACLVSVAASSAIPMWSPDRDLYVQPAYNKLLNRSLYCLINDVLNSIAAEAVRLGAVYVHTDGYIAPSLRVANQIEQLIMDWGLTPGRKADGRGWVSSTQSYHVGSMQSKGTTEPSETMIIREVPYWRWLQQRFARAAAAREEQIEDILAAPSSTEDTAQGGNDATRSSTVQAAPDN